MASKPYEDKHRNDLPVKVKLSAGCPMCIRTDQHTHTQADWREQVDNDGKGK